MYERVDTSSTIEIEQDPVVMFALMLGSAAFVAAGVWLVIEAHNSTRGLIVGGACTLFFSYCLLAFVTRALRARGPALIVSPQGLTDRRARHPQLLPWSDVRSVGEWRHKGQSMMVLGLSPEANERLAAGKPMAGFLIKVNAALGADGWSVSATGLKASFYDIRNLITAFANAHANLASSPSSRPVRQS